MIIYFVDAVNGSDANDGLSAGSAFASWGAAHLAIPDRMVEAYEVRIIGHLPEIVYVEGKAAVYGREDRRLTVRGDTDAAAAHHVPAVYVSGATHVSVNYLHIEGEAKVLQSIGARFHFCAFRRPAASLEPACRFNYSFGAVQNCDFGSGVVRDALDCFVSTIWADNNSGTATRYGYQCRGGYLGTFRTRATGVSGDNASQGGTIKYG